MDIFYGDVLFQLAEMRDEVATFFLVSTLAPDFLIPERLRQLDGVARRGFHVVLGFLLDERVPAGPSTFSAEDVMFWACKNGHVSILKTLLDAYHPNTEAAILTSDDQLICPLGLAAFRGQANIVKLILEPDQAYWRLFESQIDSLTSRAYGQWDFYTTEVVELFGAWQSYRGIREDMR
jgi:hypothetical protein